MCLVLFFFKPKKTSDLFLSVYNFPRGEAAVHSLASINICSSLIRTRSLPNFFFFFFVRGEWNVISWEPDARRLFITSFSGPPIGFIENSVSAGNKFLTGMTEFPVFKRRKTSPHNWSFFFREGVGNGTPPSNSRLYALVFLRIVYHHTHRKDIIKREVSCVMVYHTIVELRW